MSEEIKGDGVFRDVSGPLRKGGAVRRKFDEVGVVKNDADVEASIDCRDGCGRPQE